MNGTHQLPVYADVNLLERNLTMTKNNTTDAYKENSLEVNTEKLSTCLCVVIRLLDKIIE
jgi:hypothetical protein